MAFRSDWTDGEPPATPRESTVVLGVGDGETIMRALDASPIGVVLCGRDNRFIRANAAFAHMIGYEPQELVGRRFDDVTHPMDVAMSLDGMRRVERGEVDSYQVTKRYIRKDGSFVFARVTVSTARDRDGAPCFRVALAEDITERMRADEALRRSESNFRRLFDQASDGIFISDVDDRFVDLNAAACQILGYPREELIGRTPGDFLRMEDITRVAEQRERLLVDGRASMSEWNARRADGTIVPTEVHTKFLLDGRQVAFVRDISERRRAERAREESLRWVHAVLEQSPVGLILVHDPPAMRLETNSRLQAMIGGTLESPAQFYEVFLNADGTRIDPGTCPCAEALRGRLPAPAERLLRDRNGGLTPVIVSPAPIAVDAGGNVQGVVIAVQDISAAKELERLRAEWSSVVAHDLRQPLATISLGAQALARMTGEGRMKTNIERIRAAAQRLNRMVEDLMDLSRLDARRLELVMRKVDVVALVRDGVERIALEARDRAFEVSVDGDGEIEEVDADPDRVAQILENLLTNAVKYGTAGTPIAVDVSRAGVGEIAVSVTNDGPEIAPEELARLFQRFQRTSSAKQQGIKGTGLGLYITRSLVEAHGGHIAAESSPPGRITFRFTLPAARPADDRGEEAPRVSA